jgi:hypothetical protein
MNTETNTFTFYGEESCLRHWRKLVMKTTGVQCRGVVSVDDPLCPFKFVVSLSSADLVKMLVFWYEIEEGQEHTWNERISYVRNFVQRKKKSLTAVPA